MNVFISYRRADGNLQALLVHEVLVQRLSHDEVFMDVNDIGWGADFAREIDDHLLRADVVLVIIGPRWLELLAARERGDDWVRHEVMRALQLRAASLAAGRAERPRVLPLLVGGARPPTASALPPALKALASLSMEAFDEAHSVRSLNAVVDAVRGQTGDQIAAQLLARRVSHWAALASGAVIALASLAALLDAFGLDTRARSATLALASIGRGAPPWSDRVVFVAIDAASQAALGRPLDASWRGLHAQVVAHAAAAGAAALAFDLTFEDAGPPAADAALEAAFAAAASAPLPLLVAVQTLDERGAPKLLARLRPHAQPALACAGKRDGLAVSLPLVAERGALAATAPGAADRWLPSLALAAFSGGGRIEGTTPSWSSLRVFVRARERTVDLPIFLHTDITVPTDCPVIAPGDRVAQQWIDPFALPALDAPPRRIGYHRLLQREPAALQALAGRIVVVGVDLPGVDRFALPGIEKDVPGAALFVAQIDALERGAAVRAPSPLAQAALYVGLALAGARLAAAVARRAPRARYPALLAAGVLLAAGAVLIYRYSGWLVALPYALLALLAGGFDWLALAQRWRQRRRQRAAPAAGGVSS
jgi:hypothetical protein